MTMKAVGYQHSLPISDENALIDITTDKPVARGHDLLVRIEAVSVNPVDAKLRQRVAPERGYNVLGFDAVGVVEAVGDQVSAFKQGDTVWYAGSCDRSGTNSEFHLVDERIVALKPASLDAKHAAAMPLTTITAWEMLFDRFQLGAHSTGYLLVIGGAGGVGSMMIQLAKTLTDLVVIATASQPDSQQWASTLGADHVIDHSQSLSDELSRLGIEHVDCIASLTHTDQHLSDIAHLIAPQGKLGLIDDPQSFDIGAFKRKSVSIHWEFMFTRPLFNTADMSQQHTLLTRVAQLVDEGKIQSTYRHDLGTINAQNLMRAHALIESGNTHGKIVLSGF